MSLQKIIRKIMAQRLFDFVFLIYYCRKIFSFLVLHRKLGFNFRLMGYRRTKFGISLSQSFKLIIFVTLQTGQLVFLPGKTWLQIIIFEQVSSYYFCLVQLFFFFFFKCSFPSTTQKSSYYWEALVLRVHFKFKGFPVSFTVPKMPFFEDHHVVKNITLGTFLWQKKGTSWKIGMQFLHRYP